MQGRDSGAAARRDRDRADRPSPTKAPRPGLDSAASVLALQTAAGNRAVTQIVTGATVARDRGKPTGGTQAPATDAGAPPAADAGVTAPAGSEPPEQTARINEIANRYRAMIVAARGRGANVAADNLQHFLDGGGRARVLPVGWLRGFGEVTDAERTNQERFEKSLNDLANQMKHGETRTFNDHWDRMLTGGQGGELFYASGTSTLSSTGTFTLSMIENEVTITGTVTHHWHDPYDWHAGLSAYIPGFGNISDEDALLMQRYRGAQPYEMTSDWTQTLSGRISVGTIWNTKTFTWTGP